MQPRSLFLALATLLPLVLAGCLPPPAPPPGQNACTPFADASVDPEAAAFDGDNAMAYVIGLICQESGASIHPRYRIPGTPDHQEASQWLHGTLGALGWQVRFQNFTGSEYAAIEDKNGAEPYFSGSAYCSSADRQRLDGLRFSNVEARRAGSGDDIVLLAAHYDSKRWASADPQSGLKDEPVLGANDGASGVGVLLELARSWRAHEPSLEVRILLTDGEDGFEDCHPLAGSVFYAQSLSAAEADRIRGVFLLDMVGNASSSFLLTGNSALLRDLVADAAAELGVDPIAQASRAGPGGVVDDHSPFMHRGIPAVDLIPANFAATDYWHTTHDVPSKLSAPFMGDVAQVTARFVQSLGAA